MKYAAVATVILITSLTSAAQSSFRSQPATLYHPPGQAAGTCPIVMGADQGVWDRTVRVRDGNKERVPQGFGQRISLSLKDSRPSRIQTGTVRVIGLTGKNQVLQTDAKTLNADGIRTLNVSFGLRDEGVVEADLWLPGFTAVNSVELLEVTYADGGTWKVSGPNVCRVQPNPFMLITER